MALPPSGPIPGSAPSRTVLDVRVNRLRCLWVAAVGFPLYIAFILLDPVGSDRLSEALFSMASVAGGVPAMIALGLLLNGPHLRYYSESGIVIGPERWGRRTEYPRSGFDRIEYSVYDSRIYEIRPNGKRRRLPVSRWFVRRRDWEALVDLLIAENGAKEVREPS
jgi:hypothetical protein